MSIDTEPKTEGRIPNLIEIFKKLVAEDPLLALIATVILLPVGVAIANASLTGNFEVIPILLIVEAVTIIFCCVPLIITKSYKQNQATMTKERTKAVKTEAKVRLSVEKNKQVRFNELVTSQIQTLEAKRDYVLGQSHLEDRKIFAEIMEELHSLLKSGKSTFVSQADFVETIEKVLMELSGIYQDLELVKTSTVDKSGPQIIEQKHPPPVETGSIEDVQHQLDNYKANYEALERTHADAMARIEGFQGQITGHEKLIDIKDEDIKQLLGECELYNKNYLALRKEFDQYKAGQEPPEALPGKLDEQESPTSFDDSDLIIHQVTETEERSPDLDVAPIQEALKVIETLEDETEEKVTTGTKIVDTVKSTLSSIREKFPGQKEAESEPTKGPIPDEVILDEVAVPIKPLPQYWVCPKCRRGNDQKKVRCPVCGTAKPVSQ